MSARPILLLFLAFFVTRAFALDLNDRLEDACFTEISMFCRKAPRKLEPRLKCLKAESEVLTPRCANGIKAVHEAIAKTQVEAPLVESTASVKVSTKAPAPALPTEIETHLTRFDGSVYVHLANQQGDQYLKAEKNMPLDKGDLVRTGTDGKAELTINAESVIELGPDTDFQIDSLDPKKIEWRLLVGSFVAKIRSLVEGQDMRFNTASAVAAIRGTELAMKQDADTTSVAVLDEGRVTVTSAKGGEPVFLKPNQETRVQAGKGPTPAVALTAKPDLRKQIEEARSRATQVKKEWKPMGAKGRADMRQLLGKKPAIAGDKLTNVQRKAPAAPVGGKPAPGSGGKSPAPAPAAGKGASNPPPAAPAAGGKAQAAPQARPASAPAQNKQAPSSGQNQQGQTPQSGKKQSPSPKK